MKQTLVSFPMGPITGVAAPKVRIAFDVPTTVSTGERRPAGDYQSNFVEIALTQSGSDWDFPSTERDTTDDSTDPNATCTAYVMNGSKLLFTLWERWVFTASHGPTVTFTQLEEFNISRAPLRDDDTYSKRQWNNELRGAIEVGNPATTSALGRVKTSGAPVDAGSPVAVITDDRLYSQWKDVSKYASLTAAVASIGSTPTWLFISSPTTITANTTIPNNVTLAILPGGIITAASAFNLTVMGGIIDNFVNWIGTNVTLKFSQLDSVPIASVVGIRPEWFDVATNFNGSIDNSTALTAAANAQNTSRGIPILLAAKAYRGQMTVPVPTNAAYPVYIKGQGGASIRGKTTTQSAISYDATGGSTNAEIYIEDVYLIGFTNHTVPVLNLTATSGVSGRIFGGMRNVYVQGGGNIAPATYLKGALGFNILNYQWDSGSYGLVLDNGSNVTAVGGHGHFGVVSGIYINGGGQHKIIHYRIEDSANNNKAIVSISGNGSTVTVQTGTHGLETGDRIIVSGTSAYNFTTPKAITVTDATHFTYADTPTGAESAGTVQAWISCLRIKDSNHNEVEIHAEGKTQMWHCVVLESAAGAGETIGTAHNTITGALASPERTDIVGLATVLINGNSQQNSFPAHLQKADHAGYSDILIEANALGTKPRANRGTLFTEGINALGGFVFTAPSGGLNNRFEVFDRYSDRPMVFGDKRNLISATTLGELDLGSTLYSNGAASILTHVLPASYANTPETVFINNSAFAMRLDPSGSETWRLGGAGKYLEIPVGGSVKFTCTNAGTWEVTGSSGTITYEP